MAAQRIQQSHCERGTRRHPGARRKIAVILNPHTLCYAVFAQDTANGGVLNLFSFLRQLNSRIDDPVAMLKKWRQRAKADVAVFVDSGSEDRPTMLPIP